MSPRAAAWLAWSLCALSLALTAISILLLNRNLAHPNTYLYDYWLDNTLGTLCYAPVGALIAARRPSNPVGWLLCLWGVALSTGHFSSHAGHPVRVAIKGTVNRGVSREVLDVLRVRSQSRIVKELCASMTAPGSS
jgi:hypothetical protein